MRDWDIDPSGTLSYQYEFVWPELKTTARVDGKIWGDKKELLRYQSVWFTSPQDTAGSSFLNTWYYDQNKFPDLQGYLAAFRRVRQFPTNQRFEPVVPGVTILWKRAGGFAAPCSQGFAHFWSSFPRPRSGKALATIRHGSICSASQRLRR